MFSVVIEIFYSAEKLDLDVSIHAPFPNASIFSSMHTVQSPVLSRVQLLLKLHFIADCWIDPTLKCYKKKLRERKNKQSLWYFLPFLAFLFLLFFACKPRHHWNHNPPANSNKAAVTGKRTFKIQLHTTSYSTLSPVAPSLGSQEAVFCGYSY